MFGTARSVHITVDGCPYFKGVLKGGFHLVKQMMHSFLPLLLQVELWRKSVRRSSGQLRLYLVFPSAVSWDFPAHSREDST